MCGDELSFDEPAGNLALDEALLLAAESGETGAALRIWESPHYFVVLGVSQQAAREANLEACAREGIPITRRCSAGGCVLQGPGCLNYSLVLDMTADSELATIRRSYCAILTHIRDAYRRRGIAADLEGTSDLAVSGLKFSGNAQRRKKRYLLHHGTVLYGMDDARISAYLLEPEVRPEYRGARVHGEFIRNVPLQRSQVVAGLLEAFPGIPVVSDVSPPVWARMERLLDTKYRLDEWTYRR